MQTILITGANRGLGLEFCRQYAEAGWRVIAACRQPSAAQDLSSLAKQYPNLQIEVLEVADFDQTDKLAAKLANESVDVLLNNAGIYPDLPGQGLGHLDYAAWEASFRINSMAPVKMAEAFLPCLKRGKNKLIVSVSSLMGSMADNQSGGSLLYRSSKAALNAAMKSLAVDLSSAGIGILILHPGWVRTDMGGKNALIDVKESVSGMRQCIGDFTLAQSGNFIKYDGSSMPW